MKDRITHRDFNASQTSPYCDWPLTRRRLRSRRCRKATRGLRPRRRVKGWTYDAASRCTSVIHRHQPPTIGDTPSNPNDPIIAGANLGRDDVGNPLWREDVQTVPRAGHAAIHARLCSLRSGSRLVGRARTGYHASVAQLREARGLGGPEPPTKRGTLNAGKTDISSYTSDTNLTQRQQWSTLDALGNWDVNAVTKAGTTLTLDARQRLRRPCAARGRAASAACQGLTENRTHNP